MNQANVGVATLPVVRALLDEARSKKYVAGNLGIRARPEWTGVEEFDHHGVPVTVVPCVSTLAVRDALLLRADDRWLVILTDRDNDDLGAGVRAHLLWHRLRTPDPWSAVQSRFAAHGLDPALTTDAAHRDLASGLLATTPVDGGWPPAPGGVLTREHALGCVASRYLHILTSGLDATAVLTWTARPETAADVAALRSLGTDALADAVLTWLASHVGNAGSLAYLMLRNGKSRQVLPVGLVLGILNSAQTPARSDDVNAAAVALARLEPVLGTKTYPPGSLESWATESERAVGAMLRNAQNALGAKLLVEADALLDEIDGVSLAESSDLLPAGLTARLERLGAALRTAVADDPVTASDLASVEAGWSAVERHALAARDPRVAAFHAAVRMTRWLTTLAADPAADLTTLHVRYLEQESWVDAAVNDAAPGVGTTELGSALSAVLLAVRARRDQQDMAYAHALAAATRDDIKPGAGVLLLEDLLATTVLPLARKTPVLLLVLDGMSAAVGAEIVANVLGRVADGWAEAVPAGRDRRIGAVAVLPSVTKISRASLLSGELCVGEQPVEQKGFAALVQSHGLAGARLFHKKPLDSSQLGFAVADDVGAAIDDKSGNPLVTCILNTIDDALDRSDPAGTVWTAETVKHLGPLLDRARVAGRTVILTSDHGHIVERRQGAQRSDKAASSNRSRPEGEVGPGELLFVGRRVLDHGGRAVLAVDERLRYQALKAGYHGGAAPAEVVVPVYILVPGGQAEPDLLTLAPPQEPPWWTTAAAVPTALPADVAPTAPAMAKKQPASAMTLFDDVEVAVAPSLPTPSTAAKVLGSAAFTDQRSRYSRLSVTDHQVQALLDALLRAPGRRLAPTTAAQTLAVPPTSLRGAVVQVTQLLNLEGFAVLSIAVDGTVLLDEQLLLEQFELGT